MADPWCGGGDSRPGHGDNGNGGTSGSLFCGEWLLGEIQVDPTSDVINLVPRGGGTPIPIMVDRDATNYRAWMAPWQEVTFNSLDEGDWIAVCIKDDGVAKVVILLEVPQKPLRHSNARKTLMIEQ